VLLYETGAWCTITPAIERAFLTGSLTALSLRVTNATAANHALSYSSPVTLAIALHSTL
jgi:hypothetical protein